MITHDTNMKVESTIGKVCEVIEQMAENDTYNTMLPILITSLADLVESINN